MASSEVDIGHEVLFAVGDQHSASRRCNPRSVSKFNSSTYDLRVIMQIKVGEISFISTCYIFSFTRRRLAENNGGNSDEDERFFKHFKLICNLIHELFKKTILFLVKNLNFIKNNIFSKNPIYILYFKLN